MADRASFGFNQNPRNGVMTLARGMGTYRRRNGIAKAPKNLAEPGIGATVDQQVRLYQESAGVENLGETRMSLMSPRTAFTPAVQAIKDSGANYVFGRLPFPPLRQDASSSRPTARPSRRSHGKRERRSRFCAPRSSRPTTLRATRRSCTPCGGSTNSRAIVPSIYSACSRPRRCARRRISMIACVSRWENRRRAS